MVNKETKGTGISLSLFLPKLHRQHCYEGYIEADFLYFTLQKNFLGTHKVYKKSCFNKSSS